MGSSAKGVLFYGIVVDKEEVYESNKEKMEEEWSEEEIIEDVLEELKCGLNISEIGFSGYGSTIIYSGIITATYDETVEIKDLKIDKKLDDKFRSVCEKLGITYEQPKWLLSSYNY